MPYPQPNRIYPLPNRLYPVRVDGDDFFVSPGSSRRVLLGSKFRPFADLVADPSKTITVAEYKAPGDVSFTAITVGSNADLLEAARMVAGQPTAFSTGAVWTLQLTESGGLVRTKTLAVATDVRIGQPLITCVANQVVRPFASATFAETVTDVASAAYSVSGAATVAKTAMPRPVVVSGTHDGAGNSPDLVDSTADFDELPVSVGDAVANTTDGSEATVATISGSTITGTLSGGTDNDWDAADAYEIYAADDLIKRVGRFEYKPSAAGIHVVTLFVTDTGANEFSASVRVQVS